jgi:vesicle coat complex subunit
MKNYKSDDIDYTLLILEYITSDVEVYEFVNAVMKEDIKSNNRFDKILKYMFQTITPELRHCLGAIRAGSKEINFNSIVKEGF